MKTTPQTTDDPETTSEQLPAKTRKPRKKSTTSRHTAKTKPRGPSGPLPQMADPEYRKFRSEVSRQNAAKRKANGGPSNSRLGIPDGMRREEAEAAWARAGENAKTQLEALRVAGVVGTAAGLAGDAEMAEEAMLVTLKIMHSPMNQQIKSKAARQVLEWSKAKPATRTETTVGHAEAYLETLSVKAGPH